jgi:arginyl-tRNA synthetase
VTDARQAQHFRQILDAAKRAGWTDGVEVDHIMFGMILGSDGTPFKARSGESVKLIDVLNEAEQRGYDLAKRKAEERNVILPEEQLRTIGRAVGIGGIKYFDLARDAIGNYTFDWEQMLATDGNTAPYLQYAYARIRSIFRKSGTTAAPSATLRLENPFEVALARHILRFGEIIELVTRDLKPHYICAFLYELATKFSGFYENCPVIQSEEPTRSSRLALCDVTAKTLALGLDLLGIAHPEQM